jgi:hypothetical protein
MEQEVIPQEDYLQVVIFQHSPIHQIDYITIASTGAGDFGDLTDAKRGCDGGNSPLVVLFGGGQTPSKYINHN